MLSLLSYTGCVVNVVTVVGFRGRKRGCCVRMFVFRVFLFIADFPKKIARILSSRSQQLIFRFGVKSSHRDFGWVLF